MFCSICTLLRIAKALTSGGAPQPGLLLSIHRREHTQLRSIADLNVFLAATVTDEQESAGWICGF